MARPESIECEVCGTVVAVAAKGRVPRFCDEHTAADLPSVGDLEVDGPQPVTEPDRPVDDGWPRQIAPVVWVDQKGRRYDDQGAAERAAEELRG